MCKKLGKTNEQFETCVANEETDGQSQIHRALSPDVVQQDWRPVEKDIMPAHLGKINLSTRTILSLTSSLRWPKGTYIETKKLWVWLDMLNYATQLKIFLWVITMCNELEDLYWLPAEILMINESYNLIVQDHFGDTILVTQPETVIWRCSSK